MTGIEYPDLTRRLTPEADQIFCEMALAHLEAGSGDRLFIRSDTLSGTGLHFRGPNVSKSWQSFDGGAIEDLIGYGLLHVGYSSRGTPNYRVSGEGLHFYRWLMEQKGSPISQVDDVVRGAVAGADFAKEHPGAAHHLSEAFVLLWSDNTSNQVVAEIGEHLRGAIMDIASDLSNGEGPAEKPIEQLGRQLHRMTEKLGDRERVVVERLIDLAAAALRLDQRLAHVRDEGDKDRPLRSWDEARRAAFTTAFICYELAEATKA
ncbi:MAG: hypothetical protein ABFR89_04660 [Actinomycetota bacterium]